MIVTTDKCFSIVPSYKEEEVAMGWYKNRFNPFMTEADIL